MTNIGFADTQTMRRAPAAHPVTAAAAVIPSAPGPWTLVTYTGTFPGAAGNWWLDGPCPCRCGGYKLHREERDGLHQLIHVSAGSVTRWAGPCR